MKKRKMQKQFSNRWLYTFIALGILLIIGVGVYADANGVGHDFSQLQTCSDSQILKMNGAGAWACANDATGGITSETDPTVIASVKDGVSWTEVSGKPNSLETCTWRWSGWLTSSLDIEDFISPSCVGGEYPVSCLSTCDKTLATTHCEDPIVSMGIDNTKRRCVVTAYDVYGGNEHKRKVGVLCCAGAPVTATGDTISCGYGDLNCVGI